MYVVRSKKGQPLAHFKTKREAEVYVRVHSASRSPREDEAARKHREALLNRAKRTRATYPAPRIRCSRDIPRCGNRPSRRYAWHMDGPFDAGAHGDRRSRVAAHQGVERHDSR